MRTVFLAGILLSGAMAFGAPSKTMLAKAFQGPTASASTALPVKKTFNDLKSYRDWKSEKIKVVTDRVDRLQGQIQISRTSANRALQKDLEQQLVQEQWNLEVASDLSVTDYLVLYLAQQGHAVPLAEAARKLSPEEIAQVMEAYLRTTGTLPSSGGQTLSPEAALIGH